MIGIEDPQRGEVDAGPSNGGIERRVVGLDGRDPGPPIAEPYCGDCGRVVAAAAESRLDPSTVEFDDEFDADLP